MSEPKSELCQVCDMPLTDHPDPATMCGEIQGLESEVVNLAHKVGMYEAAWREHAALIWVLLGVLGMDVWGMPLVGNEMIERVRALVAKEDQAP